MNDTRCWNILVVDDDSAFVEIVQRQLQKYDCHIGSVETCEQALAYIRTQIVDCVLMDQRLAAQRTGTDCVRKIRAAAYRGSVIIMTGFPEERDIFTAVHAGADDYLDKGKMIDQLYASIKGAIQVRAEAAKLIVPNSNNRQEIEQIRKLLREATDLVEKLAQQ